MLFFCTFSGKGGENIGLEYGRERIAALTQEVVDAFIKKIYAYKDKRVEIEWNFSMDKGSSQAKIT